MDIDTGIFWESCEGMKELIEGVLNLVALEHNFCPHSQHGIVILRVLHEVAYGQNYVSTSHDQRQVIEEMQHTLFRDPWYTSPAERFGRMCTREIENRLFQIMQKILLGN